MKRYGIYTRNQSGTTIYCLGLFESIELATIHAKANYRWYTDEPIIELE